MAGFKNLEDLVSDLSDGLRKLRAGELEPEELTPLVEDARELSDRLILLRFKAHEFSYEVRRKSPEGGVDDDAADRQPVRPFRIGAAYQTSLIDAIEEVSREQAEQAEKARLDAGTPELFDAPVPVPQPALAPKQAEAEPLIFEPIVSEPADSTETAAEKSEPEEVAVEDGRAAEELEQEERVSVEPEPMQEVVEEPEVEEPVSSAPAANAAPTDAEAPSEAGAGPSLAEHLERQPISDLRTAFSLVEKYECIKMLFADDAVEFNRVLEALEAAGNYELAVHWLGQQVEASKDWDQEDPVVMRFLDRVERRYH